MLMKTLLVVYYGPTPKTATEINDNAKLSTRAIVQSIFFF